jgi:hypothetical protein
MAKTRIEDKSDRQLLEENNSMLRTIRMFVVFIWVLAMGVTIVCGNIYHILHH